MKDFSKPPYQIHEGACALNAVIKAIKDESILLLDVSKGISISSVAIKANEVADFLKIKHTANNDIGHTVIAVQLLIEKILSDEIISKQDLETIIESELKNFMDIHKS